MLNSDLTITDDSVKEMSFNSDPVEELYYGRDKVWPKRYVKGYIEFDCPARNSLIVNKLDDYKLYYQMSGDTEWQEAVKGQTCEFGGDLGSIRFRGEGNVDLMSNYYSLWKNTVNFSQSARTGNPIKLSGSLLSLWYLNVKESDTRTVYLKAAFQNLYDLDDASELIMPFNASQGGSCSMLFASTDITKPPLLSATQLGHEAYKGMFVGCRKLTDMPVLPALAMAQECYASMFSGCTALVNTKPLPATTLAQECYSNMFNSCTSLVTPPVMSAKTLAKGSCSTMFSGCTKLAQIPEMNFTALGEECCMHMFKNCKALTEINLPSKQTAVRCYFQMFYGCTALTKAVLAAYTMTAGCMESMFMNCSSINNVEVSFTKWLYDSTYRVYATSAWLTSAPSSGTFKKPSALQDIKNMEYAIPRGWTVVNK